MADAGGAIGSVDAPVTAKLNAAGPMMTSDLLTSWMDKNDKAQLLSLEDLPPGVSTLDAMLELYPPAGAATPADLRVHFGLYAHGETTPKSEEDLVPEEAGDLLKADAGFSIGDLPPGEYDLRATVIVDGKNVGVVGARIKKQ